MISNMEVSSGQALMLTHAVHAVPGEQRTATLLATGQSQTFLGCVTTPQRVVSGIIASAMLIAERQAQSI